jgi:hypothetical protein
MQAQKRLKGSECDPHLLVYVVAIMEVLVASSALYNRVGRKIIASTFRTNLRMQDMFNPRSLSLEPINVLEIIASQMVAYRVVGA